MQSSNLAKNSVLTCSAKNENDIVVNKNDERNQQLEMNVNKIFVMNREFKPRSENGQNSKQHCACKLQRLAV
jgi:hypothetical protein